MVTGLFAGQHNTKLHGTITGVIKESGSYYLFETVSSPPIIVAIGKIHNSHLVRFYKIYKKKSFL